MRVRDRAFSGAPFAYVRTPLLPYDAAWQFFAVDWKEELRRFLLANECVRVAIHVASPSLSHEISAWLQSGKVSDRAARRALAYVVRAAARTTPFGAFAAIARVDVGDVATLRIDSQLRTKTRPDMGWLNALVDDWKADPQFRRSLRVRVNDALIARGERYFVYHPALVHRASGEKSRFVYTTASLKATEPVKYLKHTLREPATLNEVAAMLQQRFGEDLQECFRLLDDLWNAGFFIDELQLDPSGDPVADTRSALSRSGGQHAGDLDALIDELHTLDSTAVSRRAIASYRRLEERQKALGPDKEPKLQTDAVRSTSGVLPRKIFDDLAVLVDVMLRWQPLEMKRYRQRFIERYEGTTREVPLLELVHPSLGLGVPDDPELSQILSRELIERRFAIASQALMDGSAEVVLDEQSLDALLPPRNDAKCASSFDVGFEILADSPDAIEAGDYRLVSAPLTFAPMAGASIGRFAAALGRSALHDLRELASQIEEMHPDAVVAELVLSPTYGRGLNVSIRPVPLSHQVRVGLVHNESPSVITAGDLLVGLDDDGFYVRSVKLGKRVEILQTHVYNTMELAPPLGRLLSSLTYDGVIFPHKFDWGPAENLTFLPRLRCGRIIVSKARWRFEKRVLLEARSATERKAFAQRWRLPQHVQIVDRDNTLPLDLSTEIGWDLLADHATAQTRDVVFLEELLPQPGHAWLQDERAQTYRAEFVASFVRRSPREQTRPNRYQASRIERLRAPGSDWIYLKLYIDADDQDRFIMNDLAPVLRSAVMAGAVEDWFFVRYADPEPHIRLRMRKAFGTDGEASRRLEAHLTLWVENATLAAAEISTYEREIERYGGPEAMAVCEKIFAADSAHVLANLLEAGGWGDDERLRFAAATLAQFAGVFSELWSCPPAEFITYRREGKLDEAERNIVRALKSQLENDARSIGADFARHAGELLELERSGRLHCAAQSILDSIMHMHCNRCGLTLAQERRARLVARQALHAASRGAIA